MAIAYDKKLPHDVISTKNKVIFDKITSVLGDLKVNYDSIKVKSIKDNKTIQKQVNSLYRSTGTTFVNLDIKNIDDNLLDKVEEIQLGLKGLCQMIISLTIIGVTIFSLNRFEFDNVDQFKYKQLEINYIIGDIKN